MPGVRPAVLCPLCSFAEQLLQFPDVFQAGGSSSGSSPRSLAVHPDLATQQQRTEAIGGVLQQLRDEGLIEVCRREGRMASEESV